MAKVATISEHMSKGCYANIDSKNSEAYCFTVHTDKWNRIVLPVENKIGT
jgi:hypothetical protein